LGITLPITVSELNHCAQGPPPQIGNVNSMK
jgi:hypothetical protein